jgi:ferredoxin
MKVQVSDVCSGHGRCFVLHGDTYEEDDVGYNNARGGEPFEIAAGHEESARKGAGVCPERAIRILEE